jgi:hypothetical protein
MIPQIMQMVVFMGAVMARPSELVKGAAEPPLVPEGPAYQG